MPRLIQKNKRKQGNTGKPKQVELDAPVDYKKLRNADPLDFLAAIKALRSYKSKGYGRTNAGIPFNLSNFWESTPVVKGMESPLSYSFVLRAKQDDAAATAIIELTNYVSNKFLASSTEDVEMDAGLQVKLAELKERLMDGIVYRLIELSMLSLDDKYCALRKGGLYSAAEMVDKLEKVEQTNKEIWADTKKLLDEMAVEAQKNGLMDDLEKVKIFGEANECQSEKED